VAGTGKKRNDEMTLGFKLEKKRPQERHRRR
jgi:hypothetical protein